MTGYVYDADLSVDTQRNAVETHAMPRYGKRKDGGKVVRVVATVRLAPSREVHAELLATIERCNEAANWLAGEAFASGCHDFDTLSKRHYAELRERFGLSAQVALLTASRVVGTIKRDPTIRPEFRPHGGVPFDRRVYSIADDTLSIRGIDRRIGGIMLKIGPTLREWLERGVWKEADLVVRRGRKKKLDLAITVEIPLPEKAVASGTLGADLGQVNILTDSDGNHYSGAKVDEIREWYASRRAALQKVGTRSAKRALRKLAGAEARYKKNENHRIAKHVVARAKGTGRRIALEDLTGIVQRVTVRHTQRSRLASWAFWQLRQFITYKATLAGVVVVAIDPRGTSTTCPIETCGHRERGNRRSQAEFCCRRCGYTAPADWNAAVNIQNKADVTQPMVSHDDAGNVAGFERETPPSADASLAL